MDKLKVYQKFYQLPEFTRNFMDAFSRETIASQGFEWKLKMSLTSRIQIQSVAIEYQRCQRGRWNSHRSETQARDEKGKKRREKEEKWENYPGGKYKLKIVKDIFTGWSRRTQTRIQDPGPREDLLSQGQICVNEIFQSVAQGGVNRGNAPPQPKKLLKKNGFIFPDVYTFGKRQKSKKNLVKNYEKVNFP